MPVKIKIAETLLYLIKTFGLDSKNNIDVAISRQEIAELAATSLEQVSREITELKKKEVISTDGKKVIINDIGKLQEATRV